MDHARQDRWKDAIGGLRLGFRWFVSLSEKFGNGLCCCTQTHFWTNWLDINEAAAIMSEAEGEENCTKQRRGKKQTISQRRIKVVIEIVNKHLNFAKEICDCLSTAVIAFSTMLHSLIIRYITILLPKYHIVKIIAIICYTCLMIAGSRSFKQSHTSSPRPWSRCKSGKHNCTYSTSTIQLIKKRTNQD